MSKCALVKPIGLLCQHAAEEMALNGFGGLSVCVGVCVHVVRLNACFNASLGCFMFVGVYMCWYVELGVHKAWL